MQAVLFSGNHGQVDVTDLQLDPPGGTRPDRGQLRHAAASR